MIVFRANAAMLRARSLVLLMAAVAAVTMSQPLLAQQSGPIRLTPLAPATDRSADRATTSQTQPGRVVVEGLGNLGEDALGVLGDETGGLGNDMWEGSRRVDVVRLLRELPESYPLREAYVLARRVLSSAARPPRTTADGQGMLAPRIEKLAAIGASASALRLANAVNANQVPDHLAAGAVRAHFSTGKFDSGCAQMRDYRGGYATAFWQQALIVCQVADGDPGQAALGLDLLREQGLEVDPAFADAALQVASSGTVKVDLSEVSPPVDVMTFLLWLAANAELPQGVADIVAPGLLPALMTAAAGDPDLRLAAAHRALRLGVLSGEGVTHLYRDLQVSEAEMAAALTAPDTVNENRLLAYLYLAAAGRDAPVSRSEALWEAWTRSAEIGGFDIVALTTADLLRDVPVTPDFGWLSGVATQTTLLAGQNQQALEWYQQVSRQAPIVPELSRSEAALWPPMRAIGRAQSAGFSLTADQNTESAAPRGPVPWNAARLDRWIDLANAGPTTMDAGSVLAMLSALGDEVDEAQWREVPLQTGKTAQMPDMAVLDGLARAAETGRKAETALYVLHALGRSGDTPHDSVVVAAIRALNKVGMADVAQAIAREAMMGDVVALEQP